MATTNHTNVKDETINIRSSRRQRDVIDQAANLRGTSRSDFMLEASYREAENVLLDQTLFVVDPDTFDRFQALLDTPPVPSDALRKMLTRKAPWE